ncbi:MAG: hypothetical protein DRP83_07590, partial [Planctomycetota bacterium]
MAEEYDNEQTAEAPDDEPADDMPVDDIDDDASAGETPADYLAEIDATVEAILFASDSPLSTSRISATAELPGGSVKQAIARLNRRYEQNGAAFRIEEIAGGFCMMTLPEYNDVLRRLLNARKDSRLSQAS